MSDQPPVPKAKPVSLRSPEDRYAHVVRRLKERAGIDWAVDRVAHLEKKIKFVRTQHNLQKIVPHILPCKIGEEKEGQTHFYRVMIANAPHTFVWSQICRGLISYRGPGELIHPTPPPAQPVHTPGSDPVAGMVYGLNTKCRDLSGCDPV
jgi:hypothetical protein